MCYSANIRSKASFWGNRTALTRNVTVMDPSPRARRAESCLHLVRQKRPETNDELTRIHNVRG